MDLVGIEYILGMVILIDPPDILLDPTRMGQVLSDLVRIRDRYGF